MQLPESLTSLEVVEGELTEGIAELPLVSGLPQISFKPGQVDQAPKRVGVVLSGGQAPGGHNVIAGLFDALQAFHPDSVLIGFLGGPSGIIDNEHMILDQSKIDAVRNLGGFDIIGSGRTKIETDAQLESSLETVLELKLDGLVIIGGDDSNTNAAVLANFFLDRGCNTCVVGVPKTIDGDLKNDQIEISFGHDTACRVYSELIGNLMRDAMSARKYYHFVKLMGRSASHITLECALQTHPTTALIGEEVAAKGSTLAEITTHICDTIAERANRGMHYGVILVPEGLIEFIPEIGTLIGELNESQDADHLSPDSSRCFGQLPRHIQEQLLLDRDPHGNVQVSRIETERLLLEMVQIEMKSRGIKFSGVHHFFGYEGRSALPTEFDCRYTYGLGAVAALLVQHERTGYMAGFQQLSLPTAAPITGMMGLERRHGALKPVIAKALVDLQGAPFRAFVERRARWATEDQFRFPGPIQFGGPPEPPFTLQLER
jgi:diphosphate-dependent phosphofructokinase